jgi:hypothetical protein
MKQLRASVRLLGVLLLALSARTLVNGLTPVAGVSLVVTAGLLVAALRLARTGNRLEPSRSDRPSPS